MFIQQPLNHLAALRRWAQAHHARVDLCTETFELSVRYRRTLLQFLPKFAVETPQGPLYSRAWPDDGVFVGWLPYATRTWPSTVDKLLFKQACRDSGVRTPRHGTDPASLPAQYLIKSRRGSFGQQVQGPWSGPAPRALAEDEFFEAFVLGRSAKVWYWNGVPLALDLHHAPTLLGDGRSTIAQLLGAPRRSHDRVHTVEQAAAMLQWQGLGADSVLPEGASVALHYQHHTPFDQRSWRDADALPDARPKLRAQLLSAGRLLSRSIPAQFRRDTLVTLDAVVDDDDQLWWLEMNSNPMVHPKAYAAMLDDLFELTGAAAAAG